MKIVSVVNFAILQSLVAQTDYFEGKLFFRGTFSCSETDFTASFECIHWWPRLDLNLQRFFQLNPWWITHRLILTRKSTRFSLKSKTEWVWFKLNGLLNWTLSVAIFGVSSFVFWLDRDQKWFYIHRLIPYLQTGI